MNGALIGEAVAGVGDDETMMDLDLLGREDQEFLFSSLQDTWRQDTSHDDNQATVTQVKTEQTDEQLASSPPVTTIKEEIKEEEPEEHLEGKRANDESWLAFKSTYYRSTFWLLIEVLICTL